MRTLELNRGVEGPVHDPYSWTEITSNTKEDNVTYHTGLVEWILHNGVRMEAPSAGDYDSWCHDKFKKLTGMSPEQFVEYYERIQATCRKCGRIGNGDYVDGFPGETFLVCICGDAISYHFDESAVI